MGALGLRPSGRLGLSPRRRRPFTPSFAPEQIADLAVWYMAGGPPSAVTGSAIEQAFGQSANGRHGPSSNSGTQPLDASDPDGEVHVMAALGVNSTLTVVDQERSADRSPSGASDG